MPNRVIVFIPDFPGIAVRFSAYLDSSVCTACFGMKQALLVQGGIGYASDQESYNDPFKGS